MVYDYSGGVSDDGAERQTVAAKATRAQVPIRNPDPPDCHARPWFRSLRFLRNEPNCRSLSLLWWNLQQIFGAVGQRIAIGFV